MYPAMSSSKPWTGRATAALFLTALTLASRATASLSVVHKDVVILGGGASGTHAAVRLREDYGKSVLLIEKEPILGGHVNTYTNPATGEAFNYGVQSYIDYGGAKAFFARFGIPTQPGIVYASTTAYVDAATGQPATDVPAPPSDAAAAAALVKYRALLAPWDDLLLPGYWHFPPGDQIPADLLLPFADFVAKHGLEAMAAVLSFTSGQSIADTRPTLYVVMNFGTPVVACVVDNTCFDPVPFDNSLLYRKAAALLGRDVALHSTVVAAHRGDAAEGTAGVQLVVEDRRTGARTHVHAKKLLVAIPPSVANLAVLGLDAREAAVFRTWASGTAYTAVLHTNLVPDNTSLAFVAPAAAAPANASAPATAAAGSFGVTWNGASGLFWLIFGARAPVTGDEAAAAILAQMQVVADGGAFPPVGNSSATPMAEVVAMSNHSQVSWGQSVELLQAGLMGDLYGLQGHQDTWYTGALWCPGYSSNVWAFTDTLLPKLVESLQ